ncbi:MAG: tetratricopeptide repeat protein [Planctomycetales bacterium]
MVSLTPRPVKRRFETPDCNYLTTVLHSRLPQQLLQETSHDQLPELLDCLPIRLRETCKLRFLNRLPHNDIAERLGISPENVRKRVQHGRDILRELCQASPAFPRESVSNPGRRGRVSSHRSWGAARCSPLLQVVAEVDVSRRVRVRLAHGGDQQFDIFLSDTADSSQRSVEALRAYARQHPGGWRKHIVLADLLYASGNWMEAEGLYGNVLQKHPEMTGVSVKLGVMLTKMGRPDRALDVYLRSIPVAQDDAARAHVVGLIAALNRNDRLAVRSFEDAARVAPWNAAHWHALAEAHWRLDAPSESLGAIDMALDLNPNDLVALSLGHQPLLALKRFEDAWRRIQHILSISSDDALAQDRLRDFHKTQSGFSTLGSVYHSERSWELAAIPR